MMNISFTQPFRSPIEMDFIGEAVSTGRSWGGGKYTQLAQEWLKSNLLAESAILTTSATDALEMAAILLNLKAGDEVIMPSFTFTSTANAFVSRGAKPVFVDVHQKSQLIDPGLIESAITDKTKAIIPVHYGGNSCDMMKINNIAKIHGLKVVEDAAQAIGAKSDGIPVGSLGNLSCLSFHGTKNVVSGEGGALLVHERSLVDRAFHISEKGTNRRDFFNGKVDKYTWVDLGSSFIISELLAAYLWAQLQYVEEITKRRVATWNYYFRTFDSERDLIAAKNISLPVTPTLNGHLFPLVFNQRSERDIFIEEMNRNFIEVTTHYTPLHSSQAGQRFGRVGSTMKNTDWLGNGLVRLPIWSNPGLPVQYVIETAIKVIRSMKVQM
jgi:dTDP-4-amino-4,6-dideoxygalactose transaminase